MPSAIRSVSQAFAILRLLAATGPLTLSQVARPLGLSPSSCLNLLRTLVDEGAIERSGGDKKYSLTAEWASAAPLRGDMGRQAVERLRPSMARIAAEISATIGLWQIIEGRRAVLVARAESQAAMRIQLADGQRQPLGGGAVGRALAAAHGLDDAEIARRFDDFHWDRPMALDTYLQEVGQARQLGYAIDDGRAFAGVCTVAVALRSLSLDFCLSASLFAGSRESAEVRRIGEALLSLDH